MPSDLVMVECSSAEEPLLPLPIIDKPKVMCSPLSHHAPALHLDPPEFSLDGLDEPCGISAEPAMPVPKSVARGPLHGAVFGLINFVVCVPTLISYAAIVFRVPDFQPDMPSLTKLFFLSSAVHQAVFALLSSLSFSVGQVQDVGLIFLSQIATSVYVNARHQGVGYPEAAATVLIALAGATTITGAFVLIVGKLKLSGYVQLLPLPVVGGYLAYIGYFCLAAGASLGTGLTVDGFSTWAQFLVWNPVLLTKLALSLVFAGVLFHIAYKVDSVAALPAVLVLTPILFFALLSAAGIELEDARAAGWIPYPDATPTTGWQCFKMYNGFSGLAWNLLPGQLPHVCGLCAVVAFGSVLDIAAIQAGQSSPLNFDTELCMIGMSNIASGCLGGFTGSYIFSQTIFSQRQGVSSASNGWTVAICEFLLFLAPVDVLQFFPGFYIGGIMAFFGIDIMLDWLVHAGMKIGRSEFALLVLSFMFVMFFGVIPGCGMSVVACGVMFVLIYSTTPAYQVRVGLSSTAMRSGDERKMLLNLRHGIVCLELRGYLFFGAALQLSDKIINEVRSLGASWVVLDFTRVNGIDSTSARALAKLVSVFRADGIKLAVSAVTPNTSNAFILQAQDALPTQNDITAGSATLEDHLDEALAWCERGALRNVGVAPPSTPPTLRNDGTNVRRHLAILLGEYAPQEGGRQLLETLASHLELRKYSPGDVVFTAGKDCDFFLLLYDGSVTTEAPGTAGAQSHFANYIQGKFTFEPGSLLGEVDFHLDQPFSYTAKAGDMGCACAALTRTIAIGFEHTDPNLALLVQRIALRSVCMLAGSTIGLHAR